MSTNFYLSLKCLHIVSVISWMAGILYLFRLYVYHVECDPFEAHSISLLKLMQRRLLEIITIPAMLFSWAAGLSMLYLNHGLIYTRWFQVKFLCITSLSLTTFWASHICKQLSKDKCFLSGRSLRFINEIPTFLMVIIVVMVVFRP